ncbi:DUF1552 domain-containing protein [Reinekea blandensis]|uniref:Tat (Twin-arginine translocation) pathway signal sequence domain protein n=1 Tax=Reinekea blandensis MED297 TaxID=314283 RepID=A4BA71_9GAMM|nr:DUF1552 domain-containing protein [Reinekea blandensis]EAR10827.1 Tat (twin-arginine translocation) pathway signal sequence domain protein [Reinekea sp. MED297] [Reinekea blandensis MED297]
MTHSIANMNRRHFLKTLGQAGLTVPMLKGATFTAGMMAARAAQAAEVPGIKRVICVYIPDGAPVNGTNLWLPSNDLTLPVTTAPLESVKQHCIFFSNATIANKDGAGVGGHGNTNKAFGGAGFYNTFDVELERTLGAVSAFPSLLLGVQSNGHGSATKKNGTEVNYQDNPLATFNRLFGSTINTGDVETKRTRRVLDLHKQELADLTQRLGMAERQRLDEHLASVEKIEKRLEQTVEEQCRNPEWNETGFIYDAADNSKFTLESELQMDTAILAMQCNLTNVVSFMFGNHQSEHAIPELNFTGDYHQSIHGGQAGAYEECRAYLSSRMTYLITELDKAGLLDSTLIIQSTDMGDGNAHSSDHAPVMMAGGGAALRGGSVVDAQGSHMNVFDTAVEMLGLQQELPQYGNGALSQVIA